MAPRGNITGFEVGPGLFRAGTGFILLGLMLSTWMDWASRDTFSVVVDTLNLMYLGIILFLVARDRIYPHTALGLAVYGAAVNFLVEIGQVTWTGPLTSSDQVLYPLLAVVVFTAVSLFILHPSMGLAMGLVMILQTLVAALVTGHSFLTDNLPVLLLILGGFVAVLYLYRRQLQSMVLELRRAKKSVEESLDELSRAQLRLGAHDRILRQYVNPRILDHIDSDDPSGKILKDHHRENLTVAFVDICEFTRLSESLPPDAVARLLNRYFDEIALGTLTFDGTIDKFIGDAALLVFKGPNHLSRAYAALRDIFHRIRALEGKPLWEAEPYPGVSAGLHSGDVISGTFGSGTLSRWDFTVIGDVVNTASRLEAQAASGQILVTSGIRELLGADGGRNLGQIVLKNKAQGVEVWDLG